MTHKKLIGRAFLATKIFSWSVFTLSIWPTILLFGWSVLAGTLGGLALIAVLWGNLLLSEKPFHGKLILITAYFAMATMGTVRFLSEGAFRHSEFFITFPWIVIGALSIGTIIILLFIVSIFSAILCPMADIVQL